MVTRRRPFNGATAQQILFEIVQKPAPAATGATRQLQRIVGRCLAKDPAERYQSAAELVCDLDTCATRTARMIFRRRASAGTKPPHTRRLPAAAFPVHELQMLAGHASITTTQRYMNARANSLAESMRQARARRAARVTTADEEQVQVG